jgi:heptosyltransferase-2
MNIVLVQTSFLGDVVLSTPLIAAIHSLHPDARLWFLTTPVGAAVVERDPGLAGVIVFDKHGVDRGISGLLRTAKRLRAIKFDLAYSLHRSARTSILLALAKIPKRVGFTKSKLSFLYHNRVERKGMHDVERNLSLLGKVTTVELRVFPPEASSLSQQVRDLVTAVRPYLVLVPGSAWHTKMWHWERYREVARHYLAKNYTVLLIGTKGETELCSKVASGTTAVNLAGKTTISEVIALIKSAQLVVCNDSAALHIASACKTPAVAVFCATSPAFGFGPWKNRAVVVEKEGLPCKPCSRHGTKKCPVNTEACMRELNAETVIAAAEKLI